MEEMDVFGLGLVCYFLGVVTMVLASTMDNNEYYKKTKKNIDAMLEEITRLQNKLIEQNARTFYLKLN